MKSESSENLTSARQQQHHDQHIWSGARTIWSRFDRRPCMTSIDFEAFVTDSYAFSILFVGKSNLKSDLDRRAFSKTAPTPRPAGLKQRPHHLKRIWQAPSCDFNRFWSFCNRFDAFSTLFVVLDSFLTDSDRKVQKSPNSLCEKIRFRTNSMCFCMLLW